ncbi:COG1361 S-layer family protein [Methanoregula sp. PtaB.Bin085]|uniref:COG1361 S-layer family protein n=1 Tax=Methanoregula sp. PtaB.Bin085 TaxID=1811680 RepID=UPI0009CEEF8A|nr:S-layer protein [Methanoregula sp. PtaB.Bin085]OPX63127.1 MAG: NPCBM-associated, NEW3 domain of alpha-galactosidase [Methanoregula sp. PtaB.Bin085]
MTRTRCPGYAGTVTVFLVLLACSVLIAVPASAVEQHLGSGPDFSATVSGTNEFEPGQDATVSIIVKNTGLNSMKQVMMGTIQPEDQQNTAKTTVIGLNSSGDAVIVKTDPQMVGDIPGGETVTVQFRAKISANATEGEYQLPMTIEYRYLRVIVQERADVFEYTYNNGKKTLPITLRIKPHVKPEVTGLVPEQIVAGSEGYLNLTIKNIGPENGTMAAVRLIRNGQSPIIPATSTVFIGDFPSGGVVTCRYKVSVSKDATNQTYPVDLAVTYTNREGAVVTSQKTTVGVPVYDKPAFTIISPVPAIPRGADTTIEVVYRNEGSVEVRDAQVRLQPHNPITASDNNAFLGDIGPGETATARFVIRADPEAGTGKHSLDSSIRYRDAKGTSIESDTIPVQLDVVPAAGGLSVLPGGIVTVFLVIVLIIAGAGFFLYTRKKSSR